MSSMLASRCCAGCAHTKRPSKVVKMRQQRMCRVGHNVSVWANDTLDSAPGHGRHGLAAKGPQHCEVMAGADLCCQPPTLQRRLPGKQLLWGHDWRLLQCRPLGKQQLSNHHQRLLQRRPPALAVLSAAGGLLAPCLQGK